MVSMSCPDPSIKLFATVTEPAPAVNKGPTQLGVPGKRMVFLGTLWLRQLGPGPFIQAAESL